jgi:GcrA cell cycle regulator
MIWNDAAVTKLKELYELGKSATQIAWEFSNCTRNAVIGKLHRAGMTTPRPKGRKPTELKREHPRPRRKKIEEPYGLERMEAFLPPEPERPAEMRKCSLMQLTSKSCRWPIGDPRDPDFFFCGNAIAGEFTVYCDHHNQIAYTTAAQRRADRTPNTGHAYYAPKI